MDTWRVDYFLVSDLIKTVYTEYGNVYCSLDDLICDINYTLIQFCGNIEKSMDIAIQLSEPIHKKIRDTFSKLYPDDVVIINNIKLKNICEWADPDRLEAEE